MNFPNVAQTVIPSIKTQGSTSTPTVIQILASEFPGIGLANTGSPVPLDRAWAIRACLMDFDATTQSWITQASNGAIAVSGDYGAIIATNHSGDDLEIRTFPGAKATKTLTISGVVADTETATVDSTVYEFDSGYGLGECTITIAAPGVVTCTGHGLVAGNIVYFKTSDTLPTGLTASTPYYVLASGLTANTFKVSTTLNGTAITTSSTQAGIHTLWKQTVTLGRIAVNINAYATAQSNTLTVDTNPTAGDTMTVGTRTYAFVPVGTANNPGEIAIEATAAGTQANIVAAINGTDGWNVQNPLASCGAFATDVATIRARASGAEALVGAIATTETFTAETNVFSAAKLGSGVTCTAPNAVTALALAVTNNTSSSFTAVDGAGDTVVFTAKAVGAAYNVACSETMANGSWGGSAFAGGKNENHDEIRLAMTDGSAETVRLFLSPARQLSPAADWSIAELEITHA